MLYSAKGLGKAHGLKVHTGRSLPNEVGSQEVVLMRQSSVVTVAVMLLALFVLGVACAQETPTAPQPAAAPQVIKYTPKLGDKLQCTAVGKLADLQVNGMSMGIKGQASGKVDAEVTAIDKETGNWTLRVSFSELKAEFAGQPRQPKPVAPVSIKITPSGEIVEVLRSNPNGTAASAPNPATDVLATGGLPLDLIAMLAFTPRFPDKAVKVGDEWAQDETRELPMVGKATVRTTNRITKLDEKTAGLATTISAALPAFEMPNPLMQGTVKVQSGKIAADKIERELDRERSLVTRSKGGIKIEMAADMGFGLPMPLVLLADFEVKPVEAEQPQAPVEPTKAGGQAAAPSLQLGPLAADAKLREGILRLALGLDFSKVSMPTALGQYRGLAQSFRAGLGMDAGVSQAERGKLTLSGEARLGAWGGKRVCQIDLRTVATQVAAITSGLLQSWE
jgi:hypothetical protein